MTTAYYPPYAKQLGIPREDLPVIPFLRNSERLSFSKCQAQWDWAWNDGLIPAMPSSNSRWFGSCLHLALAEWYTPPGGKNGFARGRHPLETWEEVMKDTYTTICVQEDFEEEGEKLWVDAKELGAAMLDGYIKHHGKDPHWEVLVPEQRFAALIPYNRRQKDSGYYLNYSLFEDRHNIVRLVGSLDLPVRDHSTERGHIKIVDHKSIGRKMNFAYLAKDNQIGTYISVTAPYLRSLGLMRDDEEITEVVFNFLKKAFPPDPETLDELGRVRNKPVKKHYIARILSIPVPDVAASLARDGIPVVDEDTHSLIKDLNKLTVEKLEQRVTDGGKVFGDISARQPDPLFWREPVPRTRANRQRQVVRIADEAEMMARIRAGELPVLKSPGEHCNWCDFRDLCEVDEDGGDVEDFAKNAFKVQDPYADHREGAVNSKEGAASRKETGLR